MNYLDTAKVVAAMVVGLGITGWAAARYADWEADLRFEGERAILIAQRDTADIEAQILRDSLELADSLRAAAVAEARKEAEADRRRAAAAEREAADAHRRIQTVTDSVVELYGDTVAAAVAAVQIENDRETAALRVTVAELRQAEARAWAAADTLEAQLRDASRLLAVERARVATRDAIIERFERSSGGHGLLVDVVLVAGGAVLGVAIDRATSSRTSRPPA